MFALAEKEKINKKAKNIALPYGLLVVRIIQEDGEEWGWKGAGRGHKGW